MDILDAIPYGKENAVSRRYLVSVLEMPDRSVREAIQTINESGQAIICCENGKGYFRPNTKEEAERYIRYSQSYLISLARKDAGMRRAVSKIFTDQMELEL